MCVQLFEEIIYAYFCEFMECVGLIGNESSFLIQWNEECSLLIYFLFHSTLNTDQMIKMTQAFDVSHWQWMAYQLIEFIIIWCLMRNEYVHLCVRHLRPRQKFVRIALYCAVWHKAKRVKPQQTQWISKPHVMIIFDDRLFVEINVSTQSVVFSAGIMAYAMPHLSINERNVIRFNHRWCL